MVRPHRAASVIAALTLTALVGACQSNGSDTAPESLAAASPAVAPVSAAPAGTLSGTVVETMDSGGYTYALVQVGDEQVWAAGPVASLSPGTRVRFESAMAMNGFHSKTLDRTFERVYFTSTFDVLGE